MYENCVNCLRAGVTCREPRITDMTIEAAITLMKARKKFLGYSNQEVADRCHMSKGTIDGIFAGTHADCRFETIRPVWNALFGGEIPDDPCPGLSDNERVKYEERIHQLENELLHKDEKIIDLQNSNASMQTLITNTNARYTKDKDFLRDQLTNRNKAIGVLSTFLFICLAVIIGALVIDKLDPSKGFFWLKSFLGGESGKWWFFKG